MSETKVRHRKTPKSPFIAGNILLAGLAASLVFFGPEPWSISTVLLVVLCLAIGGILTLLPFLLDQFALLNLNRSRSAQASVNLRGAIEKADELIEELQERKLEENPLRLVSERLPELVGEKLGDAFQANLPKPDDRPSEILSKIEDLSSLPKELERLHDDLRILSSHAATREYVEAGLSNLGEEIHRLEIKLDELRRLKLYEVEETVPEQITPEEEEPSAENEEEKTPSMEETPVSDSAEELEEPEETETIEATEEAEEPEEQEEDLPVEESPPIANSEQEPESSDPPAKASSPSKKTKTAKVIVSAFVGIQNGLYLRGDGGGLSEDKGSRLEMTGIGEWVWSKEITESVSAELFLNDETPADIGTFAIKPGDVLKLNPFFAREAQK